VHCPRIHQLRRLTYDPELYLRRPPSQNENYRLDRMLFAAAERGVKVNIIVYKEVASVLTCE
jgi:phospholipase D1/2